MWRPQPDALWNRLTRTPSARIVRHGGPPRVIEKFAAREEFVSTISGCRGHQSAA